MQEYKGPKFYTCSTCLTQYATDMYENCPRCGMVKKDKQEAWEKEAQPIGTCPNCTAEGKTCSSCQQVFNLISYDPINSPAHYNTGDIEVIDYIEDKLGPDGFRHYCIGNVLKYVSRYEHKGGEEDLKKARWYLNRIIGTSF